MAGADAEDESLRNILKTPRLNAVTLRPEQHTVIARIKARWGEKGFLKCSRKMPGFVDYADAFEPASCCPRAIWRATKRLIGILIKRSRPSG